MVETNDFSRLVNYQVKEKGPEYKKRVNSKTVSYNKHTI